MPRPRCTTSTALVLAAGLALASASSATAATPAPAKGGTPVSFGSLNVKYSVPRAAARSDFRKFVRQSRSDVVGLQEFAGPARARFLKGIGDWAYHRPSKGQARDNAIAWRTGQFAELGRGERRLTDRTFQRPGGQVVETWATTARLRHRATGRIVHVINTHLPAGVQDGEQPQAGVPARIAAQQGALDGIRAMVAEVPQDHAVVVTGDFNWDSRADRWPGTPENRLTPPLRSIYQATGDGRGTHGGGRGIDYVFLRPSGFHRFTHKRIVDGLRSDHSGIAGRTLLRAAPRNVAEPAPAPAR